jgi:Sap, sulfolipid-1-addressing protein
VISVDIELALVGLTAMLEPATLLSSVLALVIGDRPRRMGFLFYVGGIGVTLLIGVIAALVVGNVAASHTSTPKTWVAVVTALAGALVLGYALWLLFYRRTGPDQMAGVAERMNKIASAPAPAIIAAGAALANPGVFMLLAAKTISQLDPSTAQYVLDWALFAIVALLPLAVALLMLLLAPGFTQPRLITARGFVERHARTIIAVVLLGLAASLLRDGIAGLTGT